MNKMTAMVISGLLIILCLSNMALATPTEAFKGFFAVSTRELEELKSTAMTKIFEYDYKTCYDKTLAIVEKMPETVIYAQKNDLIAVYCVCLNSTPAGIFFEKIDSTHTRILISSASSRAKDWVASNVFSGKVQKPLARISLNL